MELDFSRQTEETNVPNVDQVNLKVLRLTVDAVVAGTTANSSFYVTPNHTESKGKSDPLKTTGDNK